MMKIFVRSFLAACCLATAVVGADAVPAQPTPRPIDASAVNPRRVEANYPVRYPPMPAEDVTKILERIFGYLDGVTPYRAIDSTTKQPITDYTQQNLNAVIESGDFQIGSYEWGVTYSGLLLATEATGDHRYVDYAAARVKFLADAAALFRNAPPLPHEARRQPLRSLTSPESLDECGAMSAAWIKLSRAGIHADVLRPYIDHNLDWVSHGQFRFADRTLARNRPHHNALWLDDLYMSVPALAQMGALTGDRSYFDDAARQILQFSQRMFVKEKGLFMHGWIQDMNPHPVFHWGRANGWAIVAMAELLSVMPEDHPQRAAVLEVYRAHAAGLLACQGSTGLWHQLLDRPDSYAETSASAMFVYAMARGINRGWLHPLAFGPAVSTGWNAVAQQVNAKGQVENVCIATGMGFDPVFYYHRPVSVYAAHGYGPVILAASEMITLFKGKGAEALISDGSVQFAKSPVRR